MLDEVDPVGRGPFSFEDLSRRGGGVCIYSWGVYKSPADPEL